MEYLPFSHVDDTQGNFEEIVDRYSNSIFPGLLYANYEIHFTLVKLRKCNFMEHSQGFVKIPGNQACKI